jgi:hypothetical protein
LVADPADLEPRSEGNRLHRVLEQVVDRLHLRPC